MYVGQATTTDIFSREFVIIASAILLLIVAGLSIGAGRSSYLDNKRREGKSSLSSLGTAFLVGGFVFVCLSSFGIVLTFLPFRCLRQDDIDLCEGGEFIASNYCLSDGVMRLIHGV